MRSDADDVVDVELSESFEVVLGPIGARGMPESGRTVHPTDNNPSGSSSALTEIQSVAKTLDLEFEPRESRRQRKENRFDAGVATEVFKWLTAAGAGSAVLAFLKKCEPLLRQWMKNREQRTVTIKTPNWTLTSRGGGDVKELIEELERKVGGEK